MSLADKQAAVLAAEQRCEDQRLRAQAALDTLGSEFRRSATPLRIVTSGLVLGFASGLRAPPGAGAVTGLGGQLLGGPLLSFLTESVLPGLMAGVTAAASAEAVVEADVGATVEATVEAAVEAGVESGVEAVVESVPDPAPAAAPKKRRRRKKPRVDA